MDPRTAAHVLSQIAAFLELRGENRFKARAYLQAARAVQALEVDDLGPMLRSGELAKCHGIGPATMSVIRELIDSGESSYYERLREDTPEGLLEMLRVPGLGPGKIHQIHAGLGISSVRELEEAARDGRLSTLKGFGPKTAEKVLKGIAFYRDTGVRVLFLEALGEARRLLAAVTAHPDVERAEIAGSVRRRREVVRDVDVVAACRADPARVATSFTRVGGVRVATGAGTGSVHVTFVDGTELDLYCVLPEHFAVALWRATGTPEHVTAVEARLSGRDLVLDGDVLRAASSGGRAGRPLPVPDEEALYGAAGLAYVEPELRENDGEVDAAARGELPVLIEYGDIRGVLHCHSNFSDGAATIEEMARAAQARGWRYLGISDHSESAFYAGGVSRERILEQHDEIDRVNAMLDGFRVLKGVEADILADGRVDYDDFLERFDYVIGSVHSRFAMDGRAMTARVLAALDDPHLTILGHPTGRLLLNREPYALDIDAVLEKAADLGVAVELNADPHRLDLDWRYLHRAKSRGVAIEIGPDAHSTRSLDYMELGVGMARKGWLEVADVLNTRPVEDVLAFARGRRTAAGGRRGR